jgi:uncharacterized protein with GYD domain
LKFAFRLFHPMLLLSVGALGNVRTQTLRAFSADEMCQILGRMA